MEYTKGDVPSYNTQKSEQNFVLGIYCHFGELTGALWRLPLAGVARSRNFVPGVAVDLTEQRHLANARQWRAHSRG
jgi:hypothetical protein